VGPEGLKRRRAQRTGRMLGYLPLFLGGYSVRSYSFYRLKCKAPSPSWHGGPLPTAYGNTLRSEWINLVAIGRGVRWLPSG
jgi:hypothetical protein